MLVGGGRNDDRIMNLQTFSYVKIKTQLQDSWEPL